MALIIFAFLLNLSSFHLKFVLTQYIVVIEHYSMNGVELTNMLPHMKRRFSRYYYTSWGRIEQLMNKVTCVRTSL